MSAREQARQRDELARRRLELVTLSDEGAERWLEKRERLLIETQQELLEFQRGELDRLRKRLLEGRMPADRRRRVSRGLRLQGWTLQEIADAIGVSQSCVHNDTRELREVAA